MISDQGYKNGILLYIIFEPYQTNLFWKYYFTNSWVDDTLEVTDWCKQSIELDRLLVSDCSPVKSWVKASVRKHFGKGRTLN